jgi:hypothetical protein
MTTAGDEADGLEVGILDWLMHPAAAGQRECQAAAGLRDRGSLL